ncbi:MAG: hypothetical protein COA73_09350 [Candidatus Hydrogenedentota bacterium]|nr:MAG: hypothetical protein COA73_09350 [Candidatus Hydrogenedentota bacterium]
MVYTKELGEQILKLIHDKNWKVSYEFRHNGNPDLFQPMDVVYGQVAEVLELVPRYHIFPASLDYDTFIQAVIADTIQIPRVTINGESRIVFGFGLREDHCYFVTNTIVYIPSADREAKPYPFMLEALETLETFTTG